MSKEGNTLSTLDGFTDYVNFVANKAILADEKTDVSGVKVEFSRNDDMILEMYSEYKAAKTAEEEL